MTCAKVLASLAMLAGVLSFVPLQAETFVQDGATFEYTVANDEVTITAVPAAAGRLAFPSEIGGLPVRTIAENAAQNLVDITEIHIPTNVTYIGYAPFRGCSTITNMVLPFVGSRRGNSGYLHFGFLFGAYSYDSQNSSVPQALKRVEITDETVLYDNAFYSCSSLESLSLPKSLTHVGGAVLSGCSSLRELVIPFVGSQRGYSGCTWFGYLFGASSSSYNSGFVPKNLNRVVVTDELVLGYAAFGGCSSLTHIRLDRHLEAIGSYAFQGCSALTSLELKEGVDSVGSFVFYGCSGLSDIPAVIPLQTIPPYAFYGFTGLRSVTIPTNVQEIGEYAFAYCSGLTNLAIGSVVKKIPSYAFANCSSLEGVDIPGSIEIVGSYAFTECTSLTNMAIEAGVKEIEHHAFRGCTALTRVEVPTTVEGIGEGAFLGCNALEEVALPFIGNRRGVSRDATSVFGYVFRDSNSNNGISQNYGSGNLSSQIPESIRKVVVTDEVVVPYGAFDNCSWIPTIVLNEGVTSVHPYAFRGCSALESMALPSSVTNIGNNVFFNCSGMTNLTWNGEVGIIPDYALANCSSLGEILIPTNIKTIGVFAFSGCRSLTNLTIETGVQLISDNAFRNCSSLRRIEVPNSVTSIGLGAFGGCDALEAIVLPFVGQARGGSGNSNNVFGHVFGREETSGSVAISQNYQESYSPTQVYYIPEALKEVVITDETVLPAGAFSRCSSVTNITVEGEISRVPGYAFAGCKILETVRLPPSIQEISIDAFEGCGLKRFRAPKNLRTMFDRAFYGCPNLEEVDLGSFLTYIGWDAFNGCPKLLSVSIPATVTSIGDYAFSGCPAITNVVIPTCVDSLQKTFPSAYSTIRTAAMAEGSLSVYPETFSKCSSLEAVRIPSSVSSIGTAAFSYCAALKSVIYEGNAPSVSADIYFGTPRTMVSYVTPGTLGWNGGVSTTLPADGLWPLRQEDQRRIQYFGSEIPSGPGDPTGPEGPSEGPSAETGTKIEVSGDTDAAVVVEGMTGAQVHGLPAGMTWDAETGTLGGLAAEPGTYELFLVKDGKVQRYALTVAAPSAPRARYELTAGVATNLVVGGVTGCDAYALPDGLAWDKATATLSGAARAAGTNTVYFVRGYGDDTQFFSTVLCVAAGTSADGPGNVTPGGPSEGPGDVPGTPGTQPEPEHPGVVDPGTVPEEKTSFAVLASVQLEGEARGTAKVSTESVPRGESVKLTARAANGKTLFAYWQEKGGGIVGYAANLTVTPTRDSEYVAVFRAKSVCAEPAFDGDGFASVATNAMVGVQFRTRIPVDPAAYPVRFTGSRLPNGLTIDAATGEIKGVPVKAGTFVATVKAVSRANVSKRATVQLAITVIPLPDWAQGTFEGALEGDGEDGDLRGVAHATVSSRGRISGKLMERGTNFVFTVNGYDASSRFTDGVTNLVVSATAKAGKVTQAFAATMLDAGLAGRLGDSDVWLARSPWKDAEMAAKLAPFVGLYTVQFVSDGSAGHGYLSLMVDKAGRVKATGKLADGTAVSTTLPLLWDDAAEAPYVVFFVAPTAYAGGYAYETIRFDAQKRIRGEGGLWLNLAPTATADYGEGFGCSFASRGAWYNTLAALRDSYGTLAFKADAPDLATPVKVTDEDENGKSATTTVTEWQAAVDLDCWNTLTVALDAKGTGFAVAKTTKPVQDKTTKAWIYAGENDAGLSLAFKQATGIFSGSFTCWYDYVSARDYLKDTETLAHTSKTVKFEGISVQGDPALRGFGLWEATGSYEDEKTGKKKTYKVVESYPVVFE